MMPPWLPARRIQVGTFLCSMKFKHCLSTVVWSQRCNVSHHFPSAVTRRIDIKSPTLSKKEGCIRSSSAIDACLGFHQAPWSYKLGCFMLSISHGPESSHVNKFMPRVSRASKNIREITSPLISSPSSSLFPHPQPPPSPS